MKVVEAKSNQIELNFLKRTNNLNHAIISIMIIL